MFSKNTVIFKEFFILLIVSILSFQCVAQNSVSGYVFDAETNTPLPGAHVFIANTTKGVSTNAEGAFEITGLQAVNYELVVSFVGYGTQVFDVVPGEAKQYKVMLGPAVTRLREIVVRSKKEKAAMLKEFKDNFIGRSEHAAGCEIENPDVLYLSEEDNILSAATDTALLIKNSDLGYRIKVILQNYEYNKGNTSLYFEGLMVFEPLLPKNEKENIRWAENRLKAYYGSQMHFFRALYNRRLNEEGFYVRLRMHQEYDSMVTVSPSIFKKKKIKIPTLLDYNRIIDSLSSKEQPVLNYSDLLLVAYINEEESSEYQKQRLLPVERMTQSSQLRRKATAYLLPDGRAYPVNAIEARGYWSWELVAENLPLDYDPEDDLKLLKK